MPVFKTSFHGCIFRNRCCTEKLLDNADLFSQDENLAFISGWFPKCKWGSKMKKTTIFSVALVVCVLINTISGSACGDKLLYLNRIYRHHGSATTTIAVFSRPNSLLENIAGLNLSRSFHETGYHLLLVNTYPDLTMALQSGAADVVIADIADVPRIQEQALKAKVPIIPAFSKDRFDKHEAKQFVASIKAPVKPDNILDALDRAFESREMRQNRARTQISRVSLQ